MAAQGRLHSLSCRDKISYGYRRGAGEARGAPRAKHTAIPPISPTSDRKPCRRRGCAADCVSRAVARKDSQRDEDKLGPWFYQLLRNLIGDPDRHREGFSRLESAAAVDAETVTVSADEELFRPVCTCTNAMIAALKTEHAKLVRRVEFGGEPLGQVADDLGITPNDASVRLHRARRALREALQDACGACAEHGCLDCGCRSTARW